MLSFSYLSDTPVCNHKMCDRFVLIKRYQFADIQYSNTLVIIFGLI